MRKINRTRLLLFISYILFLYLISRYFNLVSITNNNDSSTSAENDNLMNLEISILGEESIPEQEYSEFGAGLNTTRNGVQSQGLRPIYYAFLDSIVVNDAQDISFPVCLREIRTSKASGFFSSLRLEEDLVNYSLGSIPIIETPREYVLVFDSETCLREAGILYFSNVLFAVIPSDTQANLGPLNVYGRRAYSFFPFDEQTIELDIVVELTAGDDIISVSPDVSGVILQQGWSTQTTIDSSGIFTVQMKRPFYYRVIFFVILILFAITTPFTRIVISNNKLSLQTTILLISGILGLRRFLVPEFISQAVLVDILLYTLILFLGIELIEIYIDGFLVTEEKKKLRIINFNQGDINKEFVEIENQGLFSVNLHNWFLLDEQGHKYRFPDLVLGGTFSTKKRRIRIWSKDGNNDENNLYIKKKRKFWGGKTDFVFLENNWGEIISKYRV